MIPICFSALPDGAERVCFRKLYSEYEAMMFRIARSVLHDPSLAEDAVQESWLRVAAAFYKIQSLERDDVKGYLVVLVKNVCVDMNRKEPVQEELPEDWDVPVRFVQGSVLDRIVALIHEMPPMYQEILERKYVLGYTNREIGRALGLNESTVATRAMRGRRLLADSLREEGLDEELRV